MRNSNYLIQSDTKYTKMLDKNDCNTLIEAAYEMKGSQSDVIHQSCIRIDKKTVKYFLKL